MDKRLRFLSICFLFGILLIFNSSGEAASVPRQLSLPEEAQGKVEPLVLEELDSNDQTAFFIWLAEKADLSPAYKLNTKLEKGQFVYDTLVATARRTQADLRRYLDARGVDYQAFYIANKILVRAGDLRLVKDLALRADVAEISANHEIQLVDPALPALQQAEQAEQASPEGAHAVEPNLTFIHADAAWALGITGAGTVLAGNDTGLDETHPAIAPHYRGCLNPPTCTSWDHNYNWWDATGEYPTNPWDDNGHGTHTTGTMIGDDGGANQIGVAPGAQTIHCKNMTGGGSGDESTFTECFQWDLAPWDLSGANPNPALAPDAVNNSWGFFGGNDPAFKDEIQALQAAGILVEVSAGGDGPGCATLRSPADYAEVLTVGGTQQTVPFPGMLLPFSGRGPSLMDAGYFPDVIAPGDNIRSSVPGGTYSTWTGTSFAGPHATALAGLIWEACPALSGNVNGTMELMTGTAVPLTGQTGTCGGDYVNGPNNDWGYGTIDALAAVEAAQAYCSGLGFLDGTVLDAGTALPIEGAQVSVAWDGTNAWVDLTDASGYYTLTLPNGSYTVTTSALGYLPEMLSNVVVTTGTVTTQDFALQPDDLVPDPLIQVMIDQVDSSIVYTYTGDLSGEWSVDIGGTPYTILTRNTNSGEPIQKATQYVGEHLEGLGLDVEYHQWGGATYPNVIGELPGLINPDEIFIIGGHLDDMPSSGPAPGADDNASGSVGTLIAADILTQYQWGCTLRFALWTGEEQGLQGSEVYAERSFNMGENIAGYLNLDMIAWNTPGSPPTIDLAANSGLPETLVLAQLFADVIDAYNLNLIPEIDPNGTGASDHASFWQYGYTAILGIEDFADFNPYYHTSQDLLEHLDIPYYTDFVKAAVGTFAHMTNCLIPSGIGHLDGTVTASSGGTPIAGAQVVAENGEGSQFPALTNASGYYTRTLLVDTYTVTASAYGYLPATVANVAILTDTVTTQNFVLLDAPSYTVSGTVTEAGTGIPLLAEVVFEGSPVSVWTDPSTGFYSVSLPEGMYTMHVSADLHEPESRPITLDGDRTEDFALSTLPCILLVDDDNDAPDVLPSYTAALDSLGYDYNVFTASGGADGPDLGGLQGYHTVIWFSGDKYGESAGPNGTDEANLAAYLDGGGKLFLSSQDYLYDFGLTSFGQNYLGIGSYSNDSGDAITKYGLAGDPIGDGLGPYTLSYPGEFEDYGDVVNAAAGASAAFRSSASGGNILDIDKDGGDWRTVFFGTSWAAVAHASPANGEEVLGRIVEWFGGCQVHGVSLSGDELQPGIPGETLTYTLSVTNTGTLTDTYDVSLGASDYPAQADATQVGPLAPGEAAAFHVMVTIPESALPGEEDALEVTATSEGDESKWDRATLTTSVGGSYGVDLGADQTEGAAPAGGMVTYMVVLSNSGSLQDTILLTYSGVAPGWTVHLVEDSFDLAGGESAEAVLHVYIPADAEVGDWDAFILRAESSHDPSKWNEIELTTTASGECVAITDLDFTWGPLDPWAGDVLSFLASAAGTEPFDFLWNFGDGGSGTGQEATHVYGAGGVYPVTLSASNTCGEASLRHFLVVAPGVQIYLPVVSLEGP